MTHAAIPRLLLTAPEAAELCNVSLRTWRTWDAAGAIPRALQIGRSRRWRSDELRLWIAVGCPRRTAWEGSAEQRSLALSSPANRGNS